MIPRCPSLGLGMGLATLLASPQPRGPASTRDVVIVGAGIAGLSAALEAARGGARVEIVDMWSVFGGHAVMAHGGLCVVGSPLQEARGIVDSPERAFQDFVAWGEDPDPEWVRYYVDVSRAEIYEWLVEMGVSFEGLVLYPGNSVARFHEPKGRGLGLVSPLYRECLRNPNITFRWNFKVGALLSEQGRVVGIRGLSLRTNTPGEIRAPHVILATGGFQSNLAMVRDFWPRALSFPSTLLMGSGVNSRGDGHALAREVGAAFHRMDHQWNYATGLPDPRYPGLGRGLNAAIKSSIWVNARAERFVNEEASDKFTLPALLSQDPASYWAIFDATGKRDFWVSGSDWADFAVIEKLIFGNPELVHSAGTLEELAARAGLPPAPLLKTVERYNAQLAAGADADFERFGRRSASPPPKLETPPFYAVRFFPLTRKSMGGLAIDRSGRVLDRAGRPIPGLLAAGELTGLAGINGKAGLEGTFLGPSLLTGRVAGRSVLQALGRERELEPPSVPALRPTPSPPPRALGPECAACHDLPGLLEQSRAGFSHFEKSHRVVRERALDCGRCHAELSPFDAATHRIDRLAQIESCRTCHVAVER